MNYFFLIRLKQAFRIFEEIGVLRSLLLLILISIAVFKLILNTEGHEILIVAACLASIASLQLGRKDKKFLATLFDNPAKVFLIEYLFISIPGILSLGLGLHWIELLGLIIGILVLSLAKWDRSFTVNTPEKKLSLLPLLPVEWLNEIRKNWLGLLFLYLATIFTYSYPSAFPLLIIVSTVIICSFYNLRESYQLVDLCQCSARKFLGTKYNQHLKIFGLSTLLSLSCIYSFSLCFGSFLSSYLSFPQRL